jgi:hypothetical protein
VALNYAEEATYRSLIAADLRGWPLDVGQGQTLRWLVEVLRPAGTSPAGWAQLPKQPGAEGARHSVILRLLVAPSLCVQPAQQHQRHNNLPAYTVGSRRAHVPVECLVAVLAALGASDAPQETRTRFSTAFHEVFACSRATKPMLQPRFKG